MTLVLNGYNIEQKIWLNKLVHKYKRKIIYSLNKIIPIS